MKVMGILVVVVVVVAAAAPLLFATVLPVNQILASGIPIEEQLQLVLEKNSTAETSDPGIQPEDRFLINEPDIRAPPPLKILSQDAKYDIALSGDPILKISGELMNESPTGEVFDVENGEYVHLIITFYDANDQMVGSDIALVDDSNGIHPNQIYTYHGTVSDFDLSIPVQEVHSFSLKPAWTPPSPLTEQLSSVLGGNN